MASSSGLYSLEMTVNLFPVDAPATLTVQLSQGTILSGWFNVEPLFPGQSQGTLFGSTWSFYIPSSVSLFAVAGVTLNTAVSGTLSTSVALAQNIDLLVEYPSGGGQIIETLPMGATSVSFTWTIPPGAEGFTPAALRAHVNDRLAQHVASRVQAT
jgi:hypothetical protein